MQKEQWKLWFKAALNRALRTFAQTAAAAIGAAALFSEVNWVIGDISRLLRQMGGSLSLPTPL